MVEVLCVWGLGTVSGTTVLLHPEAQDLAILLAVKYFFSSPFLSSSFYAYRYYFRVVQTRRREGFRSFWDVCAMSGGLVDADVSNDRSFYQMARFVGSAAHPDIPEAQFSQL